MLAKMTSIQEDIFNCVLSGELESIRELFDSLSATEEQEEMDLFDYKDEGGRNALLTACMLGRSTIVSELVRNGAQVNESTSRGVLDSNLLDNVDPMTYSVNKCSLLLPRVIGAIDCIPIYAHLGYSSLHLAACWGHLETVKTLVELGADIQAVTFKGERPVDLARKYSRTDCADCLSLAAAEQDFIAYVAFVKQLITDPEKHLTREEKSICTRLYSSKSDWLHNTENLTVMDLKAQKKEMVDILQPILKKLSLLG